MTSSRNDAQQALLDLLLAEAGIGARAPTIRARVDRAAPAPLTRSQELLWWMHRTAPDTTAYNMRWVVDISGRLEPDVFVRAIQLVAERHAILRSAFPLVDGVPRMRVVHDVFPVVTRDLRDEKPRTRSAVIDAAVAAAAERPWDLGSDTPSAVLFRCGDDSYVLLVALHHMYSDGWSRALFFRELGAAYRALLAGREPSLPPLAADYGDFAAWEHAWIASPGYDQQLAACRERLAGVPSMLDLPGARGVPVVGSAAARVETALSADTLEALRARARAGGHTLFAVLLATLDVVLSRHAIEEDILVVTPTANRQFPETEPIIGLFANAVAVRTRVEAALPFDALLARVQADAVAAFEHQGVPLECVLEVASAGRDSIRPQVMFSFQNTPPDHLELDGASARRRRMPPPATRFDLAVTCTEAEGTLHVAVDFAETGFERDAAQRFLAHYCHLLAAVGDGATASVQALPLLTPAEREMTLREWNPPFEPPVRTTVPAMVADRAAQEPARVAVVDDREVLTYGELDRRAARIARVLARAGVASGARVAVCQERSAALVASLLGVMRSGAAYVPMDPAFPAARLALMLSDSSALVVLTDRASFAVVSEAVRETAGGSATPAVLVVEDVTDPAQSTAVPPAPTLDDVAYVLYTSGSTGRPKGVAVPHRALANLVVSIGTEPGLTPDDVLLAVTTVSFDIAGLEMWAPLVAGARVVMASSETTVDGHALAAALDSSGATVMQATPATWRMLLEAGWGPRPTLTMLCGGEALPFDLAEALVRTGAPLWNMYGPTETTIWSALDRVRRGAPISLGHPIRNTTLYVLEPSGEPAPLGVSGELFIGGDGVAAGYLGQPELTRAKFLVDPFGPPGARVYRTGDRVRRHADGRLEFLGRADQQVKVRGFRIELGDVESALSALDGVRESAAAVIPDAAGDTRLIGYVVTDSESIDTHSMRARLLHTLPPYMVPSTIVPLAAFPRTPNGKLDRKALPVPTSERESARPGREPADAVERAMTEMFADTLRVDNVGADADFFDLGGHSLLAVRLLARVEREHGCRITFRELTQGPTPADIASLVRARAGARTIRRGGPPRGAPVAAAPLSYQQELIWSLDAVDDDALVAYNVGELMRVSGRLDLVALRAAFEALAARHDALRTRIVDAPGGVAQLAVHAATVPVTLLQLPPGAMEEAAVAKLREVARTPFDLRNGAPARVHVISVDEVTHLVLFDVHHLVVDGWSKALLLEELGVLYDAARRGAPADLPPVPVQYPAYAAWQRETAPDAASSEFWARALAGAPASLALPADQPRPAMPTFEGGRHVRMVGRSTIDALSALGATTDATPFMTLLAAFAALLHRWSRDTDIVVGTPAAGRADPALDRTVGFLASTLPLRIDTSGDPTFADLIRRARDCAASAFDHEDAAPGALLSLGGGRATLPQVLFSFQADAPRPVVLPGLHVEPLELRRGKAKVDLAVYTTLLPTGLRVAIEYRAELFDGETIERLAERFEGLLSAVAAAPDRRISDLPLLTGREAGLLEQWNATDVVWPDGDATLTELLRAQARRTPHAIAVQAGDETISFEQLHECAGALAARLRALGVGPNVLVGVCIDRSIELAIALVGILQAGGAYVPLDPEYPPARLRFMAEDAGFRVLLTRPHLRDRVAVDAGVEVLTVDREVTAGAVTAPEGSAEPGALAYMIYTSGSTGIPKGALNTHRGIVNRLLWMQREYQLTADDAVLQKTPISFDVSVWELFWPLVTGARLVMAQPGGHRDVEYLVDEITTRAITVAHFVPSMLRMFLGEPSAATCTTLRDVMCSGEALSYDLVEAFSGTLPGTRLHNLYGPTEAAVDVSYWACVPGDARRVVPIGRPIANTQLHILDDRMRPVPFGVEGELYIGGVQVGAGYHRRPELTAERFVADPFSAGGPRGAARLYKTGDRARWRRDGVIEYLGRADAQVKLRGFRIELGEIESTLAEHPDVHASAVVVRGEGPDARLVAYCVERAGASVSDDALRAWLADRVPEYMVPGAFMRVPVLPVTPNGKLDRLALPDVTPAGDRSAAGTEPESPTEVMLASLWRDVLHADRVSLESNFFALGGHSLLAMRMLGHVRRGTGVRIPLRAFFAAPTLRALANTIDAASGAMSAHSAPSDRPTASAGGGSLAVAPLAYAQELLWMLEQASPGLAAYHLHDVARVRGPLDVGALERALQLLVARHAALRTVVASIDGQDLQRLLADVPIVLERLSAQSEPDPVEAAARIARDVVRRPFDLRAGPPFRAALVSIGEDDALLVLACHHLVSDGWSQGILRRDLSLFYDACAAGRRIELPPLARTFLDVAAAERGVDGERAATAMLEYWRAALAGAPSVLELPTLGPRPASPSFEGATANVVLPPGLVDRLRELGHSHDATLFMVLLALVQVVLSRYSGQNDIVVGAPVAGRDEPGCEDLVGYFARTIPLRGRLDGDPTFAAFLDRVRDACIDAYDHQGVPYERLSAELARGAAPLVQVLFAMQNMEPHELALGGLDLTPVRIGTGMAKFDLTLSATERDGAIELALVFRTDLFARRTAEQMLQNLTVVADVVASTPQLPVSRVPLVTEEERQAILHRGAGAVVRRTAETLTELLERAASEDADAIAVESGAVTLTYGELHRRAGALARRLRREGVGPDVLVGVCLDRSPEMIVALLGVLKAGGAYVPLDPDYPPERIDVMLEDTGLAVVLTTTILAGRIRRPGAPARAVRTLCLDLLDDADTDGSSEPLAPLAGAESLAYVIFTSGSTGRPKGVMIPHRAVVNFVEWMRDGLSPRRGDGVLLKAPISFDASVLELYLPLASGGRLIIAPPDAHRDPDRLFAVVRSAHVRTIQFVPTLLAAVADLPGFPDAFANVHTIVCGGEALPAELAMRVMQRLPHARVVNLYGPTETTVYSTMFTVGRDAAAWPGGVVPLGRPIANTRVYVVDSAGELAPDGVVGEVVIGGAGVARGYFGRPDLTAERFVADELTPALDELLYRTGDRGRMDRDGVLHYLGRADHQVKLRGFRVELSEVEAALLETGETAQVAAVVRESAGAQHLLAFYVPRGGGIASAEVLLARLRARLPAYMVPEVLVPLDALPLSPSGKIDRTALPAVTLDARSRTITPPATPTELAIAAIWTELLGGISVGRDDDFFALGGNSLLAIRMTARVRDAFGVATTMRAIFETPTLRAFAGSVASLAAQDTTLASLLDELATMSDEEAARLLAGETSR